MNKVDENSSNEEKFEELSEEEKSEIIEKLEEKGAIAPCPRCGHENFGIASGYFSNQLQTDLNTVHLGGKSLPTIAVICNNCGYISQHALGVLDLLPRGEGE